MLDVVLRSIRRGDTRSKREIAASSLVKHMSVSIYVTEHLRGITTPPESPRNAVSRMSEGLLKKLLHIRPPQERGHVIGTISLIKALLMARGSTEYQLVAQEWMQPGLKEALASWGCESIPIISAASLMSSGERRFSTEAWFNPLPTDTMALGQRIRSGHANAVYPVVHLFHGLSHPGMLYDTFLKLLLEGTYPCDSLVMTSTASQHALRCIMDHVGTQFSGAFHTSALYRGRVDLIPLAVDTSFFEPGDKAKLRYRFKLPLNAVILLYLGKISPMKADLCPLLRVFSNLVRGNSTLLYLVIAGSVEDGYDATLLEYAITLGIRERLRFATGLTDSERRDYLVTADIFVSPSDSVQESFGLAPVEAMACGIPQVVPNWNGYRDNVRHGVTGFLVPTYWTECDDDLRDAHLASSWAFDHLSLGQSVAADPAAMEHYLQQLIENEPLRREMGAMSRAEAVSRFRPDVISGSYRALWKELTAIASRTTERAPGVEYARCAFYKFFGHYASDIVRDDEELELTASCPSDTNDVYLYTSLPPAMRAFGIIDGSVVTAIVCLFRAQDDSRRATALPQVSRRLTIGQIITLLCGRHGLQARVTRHVMWLLKYGYVRPVHL